MIATSSGCKTTGYLPTCWMESMHNEFLVILLKRLHNEAPVFSYDQNQRTIIRIVNTNDPASLKRVYFFLLL